jgi:glycosyltransferase involved in cell wall biosynthesis
MRIGLFSLRAEFHVSGERKSTLALLRTLQELGVEVHDNTGGDRDAQPAAFGLGNVFGWARMVKLREALRAGAYDYYFIKIATIAQMPVVRLLTGGRGDRVVVLLDSVCSNRKTLGRVLRELRHEPIYAVGKRVANHSLWSRFGRMRPRAFIGNAEVQIQEARSNLGADQNYWVIPNASLASPEPAARPPRPGSPTIIGYLGPPRAYKGCLEVIESAKFLPGPGQYLFKAAFNIPGSRHIRRRWREGGGEDTGIVNAEEFVRSVDILCVPLYAEYGTKVFPNILLEAARAGVPVVTSRLPVILELLGEDAPLPYLDQVSGRHIAQAIQELLRHDSAVISTYLKTRAHRFSLEVIKARWQEFLQTLP